MSKTKNKKLTFTCYLFTLSLVVVSTLPYNTFAYASSTYQLSTSINTVAMSNGTKNTKNVVNLSKKQKLTKKLPIIKKKIPTNIKKDQLVKDLPIINGYRSPILLNGNYYLITIKNGYPVKLNDSISSLKVKWLNVNNTILVKLEDWTYLANDVYDKELIVPWSLINDIWVNKSEVLKALSKEAVENTEDFKLQGKNILNEIKNKANELKWVNDDETIKNVYNYVVSHIEYTAEGESTDWSWLFWYTLQKWNCDSYSKLFLYLLSYAWVNDVSIDTWYAYLAPLDEQHSWVKIVRNGVSLYYDPTFWSAYRNSKDLRYAVWEETFLTLRSTTKLNKKLITDKVRNDLCEINDKVGGVFCLTKALKEQTWIKDPENVTVKNLLKILPNERVSVTDSSSSDISMIELWGGAFMEYALWLINNNYDVSINKNVKFKIWISEPTEDSSEVSLFLIMK